MKKTVYAILAIAALVSACTPKENYTPQENAEGIPFVATVQASSDAYTRAVTESGGDIVASFAEGEKIALIYEVSGTPKETDVTITSVDGSGKATITGSLQSGVTNGTAVTLIYPAIAADGTSGNIKTSMVTSQTGALASNAKLNVRKGTGTIRVAAEASLAGGASLDAVNSICKFTVKDIDGTNDLSVSRFVVKDAANNVITTVTPGSATNVLYVALPASSELLWFEAVASDKPYIAKGTASLSAGNFYTPTVKMATVFNVIGANGKFYKDKAGAMAAGTTASAIIASLGEDTAETGYPHGLAIAMGVAGNTKKWQPTGIISNTNQYETYSDAIAAKESGSVLSAGKDNETDYPAFYAAIHNTLTTADGITASKPSSGTTNWFLPSAYQINLIIKSLRGTSTNLTTSANTALRGTDIYYAMQSAGFNTAVPWSNTSSKVWTSTEISTSEGWAYLSDGSLTASTKTLFSGYVLATLAF